MSLELRTLFEKSFGIPFVLEHGFLGKDPWYKVGPLGSTKEYFVLMCKFINDIRFTIELVPDEYSRPFFTDLGHSTEEQKRIFASYAKVLINRRAKIAFSINNMPYSVLDYSLWPSEWDNISLRVSRSPIAQDIVDYDRIFVEWGTIVMGMVLSLANLVPICNEQENDSNNHIEGTPRQANVTKYERNPINRKLCLAAKGYSCSVCGINFEQIYGNIGRQFIHVHHVIPVSTMGKDYVVDPLLEMVPVCPNCHAMIHQKDPPYSIEDIKKMLKEKN